MGEAYIIFQACLKFELEKVNVVNFSLKELKMVCEKCEKKLGRVITPDKWKDGARNTTEFGRCKICKTTVHQMGSHYCQGCAYKKGICAMCGKKVLETKNYKQSST